jgi:hypothetical protein
MIDKSVLLQYFPAYLQDLNERQPYFEHLLFQKEKSNMILNFPAFIEHYTHSGG